MSTLTIENWEAGRDQTRPMRASKAASSGQLLRCLAWLDGQLVWHEGALAWKSGAQIVASDTALIERAGRALNQLEARAVQPKTVKARRQQWRLARRLGVLQARDLEVLCAKSRARNPAALKRLAPLLVVESLGVELPHSPARALLLAWPHSQSALESVVSDEAWPLHARELAAFLIGAADALGAQKLPRELRGVAAMGARLQRETGALEAPVLLLEAVRQSDPTARRFAALLSSDAPFAPDAVALGRLVKAHGWERAWQVAAQLGAIEEIWPELPVFPEPETPAATQLARQTRVIWRHAARDWHDELREFLPLLAGRAPDALDAFLEFARVLRDAARQTLERPVGKRKRFVAPLQSVELAAFIAVVTGEMPAWTLHLARQALSAPDVAACLYLWCEVARRCLKDAPATHAHRSGKRGASLGWFTAFKRRFERDALPLLRLARVVGAETTRVIWQRGHHHDLACGLNRAARRPAPATVHSWAQLVRELPISDLKLRSWDKLCRRLEAAGTRPILGAIVEATRAAPSGARARIIEGLRWQLPSPTQARAVWPHLPAVLRAVAAPLGAWESDRIDATVDTLIEMALLCRQLRVSPEQWPLLARAFIEIYGARPKSDDSDYQIDHLCRIALRLCGTSQPCNLEADFRATLGEAFQLLPVDCDAVESAATGAQVAFDRPHLARALRHGFAVAPQRALRALEHLAALKRAHQLDALDELENPAPDLGTEWDEIIALAPELGDGARACAQWAEDAAPPPGALKIVEWPRKWAREIEALQRQLDAKPQLAARLNNLRARLADEPKWRAQQKSELAELLPNATARAAFAAVERAIESAFRARLEQLCGELPAQFEFDDDWFNAILIGGQIESNRKWARALLRFEARCEANWRENLPGNARFLAELGKRGVDVNFYLSRFERARGELWLWLESEPLGILQMGNRFQTCLSRGGCNAFSGIANAIELNKRVVYARDKSGRIVARQLWAISQNFELVGFHVYSNLPESERADFERFFAAHAREFASSCGLELADKGAIESLVAPDWYNDGVCAWSAAARAETRLQAQQKAF